MEVIQGTVESVNERGVRIKGDWYNLSKLHAVELPKAGAHVALGIDPKGFILDVKHSTRPPYRVLTGMNALPGWRCSRPPPASSARWARSTRKSKATTSCSWPTSGWRG
jgi:hypothetical protein